MRFSFNKNEQEPREERKAKEFSHFHLGIWHRIVYSVSLAPLFILVIFLSTLSQSNIQIFCYCSIKTVGENSFNKKKMKKLRFHRVFSVNSITIMHTHTHMYILDTHNTHTMNTFRKYSILLFHPFSPFFHTKTPFNFSRCGTMEWKILCWCDRLW